MSTSLSNFPITKKWPAARPDRIQLYSFGTPNGIKPVIALEEMGLSYEAHRIALNDENLRSPEFLSLNPNNKIPAIIDPSGPEGSPIGMFESAAILIYLANKSGTLFGESETERYAILQWLMFQIGSVGPMFGQFGHFHMAGGKDLEDPYSRDRYLQETKRILAVIERQLEGRDWIAGSFSIADIAIVPWLETIPKFYKASQETGYDQKVNVLNYVSRMKSRPSYEKGWGAFS